VKGKDVIIVDDMCDTAGTLTKAAALMMEHGAISVRAICTHAVLSGPAYERIEDSVLTELIVTDTIPLKDGVPKGKIKVLPVHDMFAQVLKCLMSNQSISSHFII
jgi:ribose-phosphate pyrophosphokinase